MSDPTTSTSKPPVNRHALTAVEKQRGQLEKLLKDPSKVAYVPPPPKEKTIRPPREMMKNVQGSSAGAGSGEFHVYKASRRREYERLKLLEETSQKELQEAEFEQKRREAEEQAESKTAKNRAKRQKRKERSKGKGSTGEGKPESHTLDGDAAAPLKKRRLVSGKELVFRQPGDESDDEEEEEDHSQSKSAEAQQSSTNDGTVDAPPVVELPKITIFEE
ncbi:PRKR-interacting protein 1 [Hypsizygus marmoreus]|uniref:PRKR-interacting protein 1 n=1 Tax=Hypsizygus marmoreus TaxID=39966 RepID=A0A369JYG2_HYPMA|nr:PRKR-interacting protein 1 [Hypsizygus marmoreus]